MAEQKTNLQDLLRTIVLVYAMFDNGAPFWAYVAVVPSKYQAFLTAHKEGKLDLYNFAQYGEIIVSGTGKTPTEEVTLKVAEMYQTDPKALLEKAQQEEQ